MSLRGGLQERHCTAAGRKASPPSMSEPGPTASKPPNRQVRPAVLLQGLHRRPLPLPHHPVSVALKRPFEARPPTRFDSAWTGRASSLASPASAARSEYGSPPAPRRRPPGPPRRRTARRPVSTTQAAAPGLLDRGHVGGEDAVSAEGTQLREEGEGRAEAGDWTGDLTTVRAVVEEG